jgi:hypothetical protein
MLYCYEFKFSPRPYWLSCLVRRFCAGFGIPLHTVNHQKDYRARKNYRKQAKDDAACGKPSIEEIARALGGEISGSQVEAPGPGHSSKTARLPSR